MHYATQGVSDHRPSYTRRPIPTRGTRSAFWYISAAGAIVTGVSAIVGTSMISVGHLLGSALFAIGVAGLASRQELAHASWVPTRAVFALLSTWVTVGYLVQVWAYYHAGGFLLWDLGIYADLLSNAATFGRYYSGPMQIHGLADHFSLALLLFVPLFQVAPSLLWLVGAKFVCFLVTPLLLLQLGRVVLGSHSRFLFVVPCLWLVHTPLAYAFLFQFQAIHLAPPLIIASFIAALTGRWMLLALTLLLTAALKEDLSLVAVCVGMFVIAEQGRVKLGMGLIAAAIGTGLTIYFVLMPSFGDPNTPETLAWFGPLEYLHLKALVVCVLVLSTGALAVLHPRSLLYVLPAFGLHFVSGEAQFFSFRLHYHIVPLTVLFVASLYGLRAIEQRGPIWRALTPQRQQWCLAAIVSMLVGLNGMLPLYSARLFWPTAASRATIAELRALRPQLPKDRELYVTPDFAAYVVPHPQLRELTVGSSELLTSKSPRAAMVSVEPTKGISKAFHATVMSQLEDLLVQRCFTRQPLGEHLILYLSVREPPARCLGTT